MKARQPDCPGGAAEVTRQPPPERDCDEKKRLLHDVCGHCKLYPHQPKCWRKVSPKRERRLARAAMLTRGSCPAGEFDFP